ncbi:FixH family protein, partial [Limnobacter sp.]|uniref:FixH family protein n=1 Tax=Limnobacter sp. TaxID=2003368 RepID=UPI00273710C4
MHHQLITSAAFALVVAVTAGCSTPADLDLSLAKNSAAGAYRVALVPPSPAPAINQMHGWKVKLETPDGAPVQGARFRVDGGMPQHGHGLPTQPRVTRELDAGVYALDGMKFSMTG